MNSRLVAFEMIEVKHVSDFHNTSVPLRISLQDEPRLLRLRVIFRKRRAISICLKPKETATDFSFPSPWAFLHNGMVMVL